MSIIEQNFLEQVINWITGLNCQTKVENADAYRFTTMPTKYEDYKQQYEIRVDKYEHYIGIMITIDKLSVDIKLHDEENPTGYTLETHKHNLYNGFVNTIEELARIFNYFEIKPYVNKKRSKKR